jgi:hypothetical protein
MAAPNFQLCPPMPARNFEHFDKYLFDGTQPDDGHKPVSARYEGFGEFSTTGIAFEDYERMSTQIRKQSGQRRLPTPSWAVNERQMRALLVRFLERRAGFRSPQPGTYAARLQRADEKIKARTSSLVQSMDKLCVEYVQLRSAGVDPARQRELERTIEGIDTLLRVGSLGVVARIIHLYYGVGFDSVGVGTEVGCKPPHVRQLLLRLHKEWARMTGKKYVPGWGPGKKAS